MSDTKKGISLNKTEIMPWTLDFTASVIESWNDFNTLPSLFYAAELTHVLMQGYGSLSKNFPKYYLEPDSNAFNEYAEDVHKLFKFYDLLYEFADNIYADDDKRSRITKMIPTIVNLVTRNSYYE